MSIKLIFRSVYCSDNRARVLITPDPPVSACYTMYRLDDDTFEWSYAMPLEVWEAMDSIIESQKENILARWKSQNYKDYTLESTARDA